MWMKSIRFTGSNSSAPSKADAEFKRAIKAAVVEDESKAVNEAIASDRDLFIANRKARAEKKIQAAEAKRREDERRRNHGSSS